ncbi:unnamed protein product, partial [Tilletia laevis]
VLNADFATITTITSSSPSSCHQSRILAFLAYLALINDGLRFQSARVLQRRPSDDSVIKPAACWSRICCCDGRWTDAPSVIKGEASKLTAYRGLASQAIKLTKGSPSEPHINIWQRSNDRHQERLGHRPATFGKAQGSYLRTSSLPPLRIRTG